MLQKRKFSLAPSELENERRSLKKIKEIHTIVSHKVETTMLISIKRGSSKNLVVT